MAREIHPGDLKLHMNSEMCEGDEFAKATRGPEDCVTGGQTLGAVTSGHVYRNLRVSATCANPFSKPGWRDAGVRAIGNSVSNGIPAATGSA
jgi:hypothetical protein